MMLQNGNPRTLTYFFVVGFAFFLISCSSGLAPNSTPERIVVTVQVTVPPPPPLPSPTPRPTYTPSVQEMWVCVDLAAGYSAPSTESAVVFQMSQIDGWRVRALEKSGDWYVVRTGDILAFMHASALCSVQPDLSTATATLTEPPPATTPTAIPTSTATLPLPTSTNVPTSTPRSAATNPPPPPTKAPAVSGCPQGCVSPPPGCAIKGNVSYTTGEKIYHVPGGKYYSSTVIDARYGERWFCTEAEAIANGWRKSAQ